MQEDSDILEPIRTVVIDPPWMERGGGKCKRGADRHYKLLKPPEIIREITQCDLWNRLDDNVHMYLWATNSFLPKGMQVMESLGFRYVTNVCWVKDRIGLGQYFRGKHELCLFGVRGNGTYCRTQSRNIPSTIEAKKTTHSRKPDEFYKMVENRSTGPYLDMFARDRRPGWIVWGDEIDESAA